ncbi:MAG: hypothetical protein ACLFUP_10310 [Desulfobacteraceae bacterium]
MVSGDEILSQSDVDALLEGANTETDEAAPSAEAEGGKKTITAGRSRTDEEVKDLLASLCRKAFVPREKGVRVIWNAHGSIPLAPGYKMEIQGRKYVALGPFGDAHLVVGRIDGEPS